jgi:hypothetical protein
MSIAKQEPKQELELKIKSIKLGAQTRAGPKMEYTNDGVTANIAFWKSQAVLVELIRERRVYMVPISKLDMLEIATPGSPDSK